MFLDIDMGQAEATLRREPCCPPARARADSHLKACWKAASALGYDHPVDVPEDKIDEYSNLFRSFRETMAQNQLQGAAR